MFWRNKRIKGRASDAKSDWDVFIEGVVTLLLDVLEEEQVPGDRKVKRVGSGVATCDNCELSAPQPVIVFWPKDFGVLTRPTFKFCGIECAYAFLSRPEPILKVNRVID